MTLMTPHLGELHFSSSDTLTFPKGLPGFVSCNRFLIVQTPGIRPLSYLQSLDLPPIAFLLVPVPLVDPAYSLVIEEGDQEVLGTSEAMDALDAHFIISAHASAPPTVNMLAPILIRWETRTGVQAVRSDASYSHARELTRILDIAPASEPPC